MRSSIAVGVAALCVMTAPVAAQVSRDVVVTGRREVPRAAARRFADSIA
ncbi:hypothetical protein [Sphingomonas sp.]